MVLARSIFLITGIFTALAASSPAQAEGNGMAAPTDAAISTETPPATASAETAASDESIQPEDKPTGPLSPTDKIVRRFMELDLDLSEGVSFEEYMIMVNQRAEDRFKSMDADEDGEVTEEEYRNFWLTRKAQWYRLKR